MTAPKINTTKRIIPQVYAYSTPEIKRHDGWVKIGYTDSQTVEDRVAQQTHTADVLAQIEWSGLAIYDTEPFEPFRDSNFHDYLERINIERTPGTEWFHLNGKKSEDYFHKFKKNHGVLDQTDTQSTISYTLRKEQLDAVVAALNLFKNGKSNQMLWNCKPRFGKTLSSYDLCKRLDTNKVLIITNRPTIGDSWYKDYEKFLGRVSGYHFMLSENTYDDYRGSFKLAERYNSHKIPKKMIYFLSFQNLKGSRYFGGDKYLKLYEILNTKWDLLIVDEAHEGVDTFKTDVALDKINRNYTLYLSGTPFKALADEKFREEEVYTWTYEDEQRVKVEWDMNSDSENGTNSNPYDDMPKLSMFTYQMSEAIKGKLAQGVDIDGKNVDYAFDLNEFFRVENGLFVYDDSIDTFLDSLTTQSKYPFSTDKLRNELKHTLWMLHRVESAEKLKEKLEKHPVFSEYKVVLATGKGKDKELETASSLESVRKAIQENEKTITLSVKQLTTGVTIPEWTAVLMLSNMNSAQEYMQAAFRCQNPCLFGNVSDGFYRKENCYIFDFEPERTLIMFETFANDLHSKTANGHGTIYDRIENIRELLNFFPVIGEDVNGTMVEYDVNQVLSVPRKIKCTEVVKRGFMSNFLFQNIGRVFAAPKEVLDILEKFTPVKDQKAKKNEEIHTETVKPLVDKEGEVSLSSEIIEEKREELFGNKIFDVKPVEQAVENFISEPTKIDSIFEEIKEKLQENNSLMINVAQENYGEDMKKSDHNYLEKTANNNTDNFIEKVKADFNIESTKIEIETEKKLENSTSDKESEQIRVEAFQKQSDLLNDIGKQITDRLEDIKIEVQTQITETVEASKVKAEKKSVEDNVRDHLRGFSRTIPSFLMAYGTRETKLENFDTIIPDEVFQEVTSITLDQFRFLRDGGDYYDENGNRDHYDGKLFDEIVFNDSIQEFLNKKEELGDYFDESQKEDIFDYIPPQKTNQIFTPKWVVKKMVDELEKENPGCFDDSNATFADLYMKSGLYITEIVKKLFNSTKIREEYPNDLERLEHIFTKQVYGMAPTEIIYRISTNYIFGGNEELKKNTRNFVQCDAAEAAKNETLERKVNEYFG